jgi:hypothetical protein
MTLPLRLDDWDGGIRMSGMPRESDAACISLPLRTARAVEIGRRSASMSIRCVTSVVDAAASDYECGSRRRQFLTPEAPFSSSVMQAAWLLPAQADLPTYDKHMNSMRNIDHGTGRLGGGCAGLELVQRPAD